MASGILPVSAVQAALDDHKFINTCITKNAEGREIAYKAFDEWGVKYADSSTSFIYARNERFPKDLRAQLREDNILITQWATMTKHVRISMGKPAEMRKCVEVVEKYVS